jgi:hypothetical protein
MRAACFASGWIHCAERAVNRRRLLVRAGLVALCLAPVAARAQGLPVLHITALGLHADRSVVAPGQTFHVTVHVHVRERRDRLDELVLPALTNAVDLGDERRRVPAADGTDFYETLTVEAQTVGTAAFSPAYIDAIDPASGRGMRYSSQALTVRVASGTTIADADPGALAALLRNAALAAGAVGAILAIALVALLRRRRRPRTSPAPPIAAPVPGPEPAGDRLAAAVAAYRARADDATLDVLRGLLFERAGCRAGATFSDAVQALGRRDPHLLRAMAVAERARFGPADERAAARADLLALASAL